MSHISCLIVVNVREVDASPPNFASFSPPPLPPHPTRLRTHQACHLPSSMRVDDRCNSLQIASAAAKEVAIRERERLRQQGISKKQQLEKVRALQNASGAETDVRLLSLLLLDAHLRSSPLPL